MWLDPACSNAAGARQAAHAVHRHDLRDAPLDVAAQVEFESNV